MHWIDENPWLAWLALALVLGAIETATVDFVFLMLVGGALAGCLAAAFGLPVLVQVVVAVAVALLLIGTVRPLIRRQFLSDTSDHGIGAASLTGRTARVVQTVTEVDGRVKLDGETWSARTLPGERHYEPGEEVRVLRLDGAYAVVSQQVPQPPVGGVPGTTGPAGHPNH